MWGSYAASLLNVSGSTQVPASAWKNAQSGKTGLPPHIKLEGHHLTCKVYVPGQDFKVYFYINLKLPSQQDKINYVSIKLI
jgi:hypothetical protein